MPRLGRLGVYRCVMEAAAGAAGGGQIVHALVRANVVPLTPDSPWGRVRLRLLGSAVSGRRGAGAVRRRVGAAVPAGVGRARLGGCYLLIGSGAPARLDRARGFSPASVGNRAGAASRRTPATPQGTTARERAYPALECVRIRAAAIRPRPHPRHFCDTDDRWRATRTRLHACHRPLHAPASPAPRCMPPRGGARRGSAQVPGGGCYGRGARGRLHGAPALRTSRASTSCYGRGARGLLHGAGGGTAIGPRSVRVDQGVIGEGREGGLAILRARVVCYCAQSLLQILAMPGGGSRSPDEAGWQGAPNCGVVKA